jgi:hypothetical protein
MEQTLAMQMMNVAMQLLQNKSDSGRATLSTPSIVPPMCTTHVATEPVQWSPAILEQVGHNYGVDQAAGGAVAPPLPLPQQLRSESANTPKEEDAQQDVPTGAEALQAQAPDVHGNRIGFKPQSSQVREYHAAVSSQGFSFPPLGGMPPGWPPADMVDQILDSKLRPPAA